MESNQHEKGEDLKRKSSKGSVAGLAFGSGGARISEEKGEIEQPRQDNEDEGEPTRTQHVSHQARARPQ